MRADEVSQIPTFWIGGRSGEGKSVLLLQLTQRILAAERAPVITYLGSSEKLPAWLESQRDIQGGQANAASLPAVAVVDDIHFVSDPSEWRGAIVGPV